MSSKRGILALIVAFALQSTGAAAATYYIDYASGSDSNTGLSKGSPWQRCPGMSGFSARYSHTPGDTFIFKGGATWPSVCLPLALTSSGTAGNVDTYTTDHAWYSGGAWSQPTFDGEMRGAALGGHLVNVQAKSYWKLNDISLVRLNASTTYLTGFAVEICDSHDFEIVGCTINPEARCGVYAYTSRAVGTLANWSIHDCDVSHCAMQICPTVTSPNIIVSNVRIFGNKVHDNASQINGGTHGDGVHTWVNYSTSEINGIYIYNNYFYGSVITADGTAGMTAWIYLTDYTNHSYIWNNVFTFSDTTQNGYNLFEGMVIVQGKGTTTSSYHYIYNNTFRGLGYPAVSVGPPIFVGNGAAGVDNIFIENNAVAGFALGVGFDTGVTPAHVTVDYNCLGTLKNSDSAGIWGGAWKTRAQWQALGLDLHSKWVDPQLDTSNPPYLTLRQGSPCMGAATNLGPSYGLDIVGTTRPASGAWDIGCYQRSMSVEAPETPLHLRVLP